MARRRSSESTAVLRAGAGGSKYVRAASATLSVVVHLNFVACRSHAHLCEVDEEQAQVGKEDCVFDRFQAVSNDGIESKTSKPMVDDVEGNHASMTAKISVPRNTSTASPAPATNRLDLVAETDRLPPFRLETPMNLL